MKLKGRSSDGACVLYQFRRRSSDSACAVYQFRRLRLLNYADTLQYWGKHEAQKRFSKSKAFEGDDVCTKNGMKRLRSAFDA